MLVKHIFASTGMAILLGGTPLSGWAQPAAPSSANAASNNGVIELEDGALTQYLPAYFAQYNSITARDMLRWVPGIGDLTRDTQGFGTAEKRGFGSGGDQVLINGKRMSGKSNTIWDELERVQAKQVERIEVIRGPIAGLDVRSEGLIFNVVLKEGAEASGSWQAHAWTDGKGTWRTDAMVSYSDTIGDVHYQASASYRPYNPNNVLWRESTLLTPDGSPFEHRLDRRFDDNDEIEFVGKATIPVKKTGSANLNIRLAETGFESPRTIERSGIDAEGVLHPLETIVTDSVRDGFEIEFGGDVEVPVGPGNFNGRFIYTRKNFDRLERNISEPIDGDASTLSVELTDQIAQELIFRGGYQWSLNKAHSLDIGAEAAFNSLDKSVALDANVDGVLMPVDLPTPDSKVKEKRGELYATHFWTVSEKIALETALNMEFSNIGQVGSAVDKSRSFFFAKPRVELRYAVSAVDQVRVSVERTISQLDFVDFVTNFDDDDDRLDAGNPDLVPEKAWVVNATFEHRLAKDAGLVSFKLFYENIDDFIDRIAITPTTDGPGNIGSAKKYGIEITTSNRLGFIGLDNAVLDLTYTVQKTKVRDAFLGINGPIRSKPTHNIKGTFRHDISSIGLSYWVDFDWYSRTHSNQINLLGFNDRNMGARLFVQQKLFDGVSLWFNWRSINEDTYRSRDYFATNVAAGDITFTEERHQWWNHEFIVGLRGVF
jgi:outer membrane receptor for ferrienterochelin and colicins